MKGDFVDKEMEQAGADGVDFVPIVIGDIIPKIYASYTRQKWERVSCIPKTGRLYWKTDSVGKKQYINKPCQYTGIREISKEDLLREMDVKWE